LIFSWPPVGAVYTLEPDEMKSVIQQLNPRVVIPMHYKTAKMDLPLLPVEEISYRTEECDSVKSFHLENNPKNSSCRKR